MIKQNIYLIPISAIIGITIIETIALLNGIDGTLLLASFAIIGGIGGYESKEIIKKISALKIIKLSKR